MIVGRKKQEKAVQADEVPSKAVRLDLDPETHKRLRVEAAQRDMSMAALVRELVVDFLSAGGKR
jgi:hypothetical protein